MEVIWKDIPGYEGMYKVSNKGEVFSLVSDRLLKIGIDKHGYKVTKLTKNKVRKNYFVHRLVALAFIENPHDYPQINHKDENPLNNNVENLEWCTNYYNQTYGTKIERSMKEVVGFLNGVEVIRLKSITSGELYGFVREGINACLRGRTKTHKGHTWKYADKI